MQEKIINPLDSIKVIAETDDYLIAIKPAGVLSQSSADDSEKHLLYYLEKKFKRKLHLLTRLDRPVSGLIILSKNKGFNKHYQDLQSQDKVYKNYIAVVEGLVKEDTTSLEGFLCHDKRRKKSYISALEKSNYEQVTLNVKTIGRLDRYSILSALITTGKFHQIRSQLSDYGHAIKGDVKYGSRRGNKNRSIYLHSYQIKFKDRNGDKRTYQADFPKNDNLWNIVEEKLKSNYE